MGMKTLERISDWLDSLSDKRGDGQFADRIEEANLEGRIDALQWVLSLPGNWQNAVCHRLDRLDDLYEQSSGYDDDGIGEARIKGQLAALRWVMGWEDKEPVE